MTSAGFLLYKVFNVKTYKWDIINNDIINNYKLFKKTLNNNIKP